MVDPPKNEEAIFLAALEQATPKERAAYIDRACAGDAELRQRVLELLKSHDASQGPLDALPPGLQATGIFTESEMVGAQIGPYRLLEQIGEGGFGIVYMADQQAPVRRRVALKIIKPGMDSKAVLTRFKAELQALALMDHPNIARALDAGATDSGRPYFVMELVRGIPITDYCDQNKLAVHERLDLFVQVCHAVQHAHQKGIVHRDIKPSNVLVTMHDGRPVPKVIDFGVAKAIDRQLTEETLFTRFAELIGTPLYMSPEQAELTSLDIDTRSDIYSLGVLLYELLTGSTPFDKHRLKQAAFDEIRRIIREEEPPKPSTRVSSLSKTRADVAAYRHADPARLSQLIRGDLDWIVMKALEKDRTRRYETANSFAMDLQRHLADEPVEACPPSRTYRMRKFVRRHKGPVYAGSALLVALVAGMIGTTWGLVRATRAEMDAVRLATQKQAEAAQKELALAAVQKSERAKSEELWHSLVSQARAHRLSHRPGQRFESLATLQQATQLARTLNLPEANFQELRDAVAATLAVPDLCPTEPIATWPEDGVGLDFDEAHATYVRTNRAGECSVRRVVDDAEVSLLPGFAGTPVPYLSRDGHFVAIVYQTGVAVWQLNGAMPRKVLFAAGADYAAFRDSDQVAVGNGDGSIGIFELPGGKQLNRLAADTITRGVLMAWHPTDALLAICSYYNPVLQLRDWRTGQVVASMPQSIACTGVAWHPNGQTIALADEGRRIRLYDRSTRQAYRTLTAEQTVTRIHFDRAGSRMAAYGWSGIVELFDVGTGERLMSTPAIAAACRFSRDGLRVGGGVQNGKLALFRVAGGSELRTFVRSDPVPGRPEYGAATVHPDGQLLAGTLSDSFGFWDLATGSELARIPCDEGTARVLFEPSGALLALSCTHLTRWPIRIGTDAATPLSIGPPERVEIPGGSSLDQSQDGRVIVTCARAVSTQEPNAGGWILDADRGGKPRHIDAGVDTGDIAVSPDGRWVATDVSGGARIKIWDAHEGRLVKQIVNRGASWPHFSSDGRWLVTSLDVGRLFAVDSWEEGPPLGFGGGTVFTPDGKLIATPTARSVRLFDYAARREVAVLEEPNLDWIQRVAFSPDGTKLITINTFNGIRVWDLPLIRQQLKDLDLDWKWPAFPLATSRPQSLEPARVKLRLVNESTAKAITKPPPEPKGKPRP